MSEEVNNDSVTISKKLYQELLDSHNFLNCLESVGVDNWDGYDDACDLYNEEY